MFLYRGHGMTSPRSTFCIEFDGRRFVEMSFWQWLADGVLRLWVHMCMHVSCMLLQEGSEAVRRTLFLWSGRELVRLRRQTDRRLGRDPPLYQSLWGEGVRTRVGWGCIQCARGGWGRRWGITIGWSSHKRQRKGTGGWWWSLQVLRGGGFSSWQDVTTISRAIFLISWRGAVYLLLLGCSFGALIGCRGVLVGGGGGWCLAFELWVAEGTCLLDIEPFLQTASVEEMTARSDHSTVHVLEGKSTDTHMH